MEQERKQQSENQPTNATPDVQETSEPTAEAGAPDVTEASEQSTETSESSGDPQGSSGNGVRRRSFLKWGLGLTGVGLVVGVGYGYANRYALLMRAMDYMANKDFTPGAFIVIPMAGKIQLVCHRSEMGQGVRTSLPMILADELEVPFEQIEVVQAPADTRYGSQNTDGSTSVRKFYTRLRKAAAGVRELLERAAAQQWGVPYEQCVAEAGQVRHLRSQRVVRYQELAAEVMKMELPAHPQLKSPRQFKLIGRPRVGVDVDDICQGKAIFGADVQLPNMVYACAVRAPVPGARLKTHDATEAKKIPGVSEVVTLEAYGTTAHNNEAICVVANNTWAAIQGAQAIKAEWDTAGLKLDNSKGFRKELEQSFDGEQAVYRNEGNVIRAEEQATRRLEATYYAPFLVHAPMEPLVSTAHVTQDKCEIWAPTQDPVRAKKAIAKVLGIDVENVTVHVTLLGGGFGRKSQPDFLIESAVLSKKIGKPVRLQWTREDEVRHGFYHAESLQRIKASVDSAGMPVSWRHQAAYPSLVNIMWPGQEKPSIFEMNMGVLNMAYDIPNVFCAAGKAVTPVRVGWFRSVCNLFHGFAVNSFIDELAEHAKLDPIEYRLRLIGKPRRLSSPLGEDIQQDTGRLAEVIRVVRDAFGWDRPLAKGRGKGFASHYSFFSYTALAMEVSYDQGTLKIHRVVCAIDCGLAVNPDSVRAQMEGAVVFGLSAALYGKITLKDGAVEQSNFHDYQLLRMQEMPRVEVHIINGDPRQPTGVGEPGVPVVAPALASAIYHATGKRLRDMPFAEKLAG